MITDEQIGDLAYLADYLECHELMECDVPGLNFLYATAIRAALADAKKYRFICERPVSAALLKLNRPGPSGCVVVDDEAVTKAMEG
jgi:hypothetical protein